MTNQITPEVIGTPGVTMFPVYRVFVRDEVTKHEAYVDVSCNDISAASEVAQRAYRFRFPKASRSLTFGLVA